MSLVAYEELPVEPLEAPGELRRSQEVLDELRHRRVAAARAAGARWEQIGGALGVSRQSAWERFAKRASADLSAIAGASTDLSHGEAMEIAVEEVRAVRRQHSLAWY